MLPKREKGERERQNQYSNFQGTIPGKNQTFKVCLVKV